MTDGTIRACEGCGDDFSARHGGTKFCSPRCSKAHYYHKQKDRYTQRIGNNLSTGTVGAIGELFISNYFLRQGWSVFRSVSPSCFCDIIVAKGNRLYKVECRVGVRHNENNKIMFATKISNEADIFAVYIPFEESVTLLTPKLEVIEP